MCAHTHSHILPFTFHAPKSKFKTRQPPRFVTLPHALSRLASRLKMQKTSVITTLSRLSRLDYPLCAHEHSGTLRPSRFAPFPQCASRSPSNQSEVSRTIPNHSELRNFFSCESSPLSHKSNRIPVAVNCTYLRQIEEQNFCREVQFLGNLEFGNLRSLP